MRAPRAQVRGHDQLSWRLASRSAVRGVTTARPLTRF